MRVFSGSRAVSALKQGLKDLDSGGDQKDSEKIESAQAAILKATEALGSKKLSWKGRILFRKTLAKLESSPDSTAKDIAMVRFGKKSLATVALGKICANYKDYSPDQIKTAAKRFSPEQIADAIDAHIKVKQSEAMNTGMQSLNDSRAQGGMGILKANTITNDDIQKIEADQKDPLDDETLSDLILPLVSGMKALTTEGALGFLTMLKTGVKNQDKDFDRVVFEIIKQCPKTLSSDQIDAFASALTRSSSYKFDDITALLQASSTVKKGLTPAVDAIMHGYKDGNAEGGQECKKHEGLLRDMLRVAPTDTKTKLIQYFSNCAVRYKDGNENIVDRMFLGEHLVSELQSSEIVSDFDIDYGKQMTYKEAMRSLQSKPGLGPNTIGVFIKNIKGELTPKEAVGLANKLNKNFPDYKFAINSAMQTRTQVSDVEAMFIDESDVTGRLSTYTDTRTAGVQKVDLEISQGEASAVIKEVLLEYEDGLDYNGFEFSACQNKLFASLSPASDELRQPLIQYFSNYTVHLKTATGEDVDRMFLSDTDESLLQTSVSDYVTTGDYQVDRKISFEEAKGFLGTMPRMGENSIRQFITNMKGNLSLEQEGIMRVALVESYPEYKETITNRLKQSPDANESGYVSEED